MAGIEGFSVRRNKKYVVITANFIFNGFQMWNPVRFTVYIPRSKASPDVEVKGKEVAETTYFLILEMLDNLKRISEEVLGQLSSAVIDTGAKITVVYRGGVFSIRKIDITASFSSKKGTYTVIYYNIGNDGVAVTVKQSKYGWRLCRTVIAAGGWPKDSIYDWILTMERPSDDEVGYRFGEEGFLYSFRIRGTWTPDLGNIVANLREMEEIFLTYAVDKFLAEASKHPKLAKLGLKPPFEDPDDVALGLAALRIADRIFEGRYIDSTLADELADALVLKYWNSRIVKDAENPALAIFKMLKKKIITVDPKTGEVAFKGRPIAEIVEEESVRRNIERTARIAYTLIHGPAVWKEAERREAVPTGRTRKVKLA